MKINLGLLFILVCGLAVRGADSFDDFAAGPVIAKGKGVEVRRGQLDDAFISFRANLAARGQTIPETKRETAEAQLLDRIIITQLLVQQATPEERARARTNATRFIDETRKNAESEESFVRHLKSLGMSLVQFTNRVLEQALSEEVVTRTLKNRISIPETNIAAFYESNQQAFAQPEIARASHILIATRDFAAGLPLSTEQKLAKKEKANKVLERARKGEDFAKLAEEVSDDPGVKENKGEYKFTHAKDDPRRAMPPEFEKVLFSLKPGEISDLVTTDFGFHIIKLHEILPARKAPLAEVHDRIKEHLVQQELEKRMAPYFAKLKQEAGVEVMDEKLRAALEKIKDETPLRPGQ